MDTESLILDWVEDLAPLTPPQSDKGDQDNGTQTNGVQDNMPTVQDMAAQAFALKLEQVQDIVLSPYHRIFTAGFLEGWKQATAMSTARATADTAASPVTSTTLDLVADPCVPSLVQAPDTAPDILNIPIETTEPVPVEPAHTPPIHETNTLIDGDYPLIDLTPAYANQHAYIPTGSRPQLTNPYIQPHFNTHRPYIPVSPQPPPITSPFPLPYANLQRAYIPTAPLHGIPPPSAIIPVLPSVSSPPQPAYPNLFLSPSDTMTTTDEPALSPSILLGPITPTSVLDWASDDKEPHAYFAEKLSGVFGGDGGAGKLIRKSRYFLTAHRNAKAGTGGRWYMRLTFWEETAAERALEMFAGGYPCGGAVVWGWMWKGVGSARVGGEEEEK